MDQHPIPRQITTFEFKLIGFMTLRQFIYLVVFFPLGVVTYFLFPIPILNLILGVVVGSLGLVFAFVPILDRPADIWVKNLYKRLMKPTQYFFSKSNPPIYFLSNLFFTSDPHQIMTHIESQEKLAAYLAQTKQIAPADQNLEKKSIIDQLFKMAPSTRKTKGVSLTQNQINKFSPYESQTTVLEKKAPFLTGVVKNHKLIPLPGVLIYIKGPTGQTMRLLKTNPHGIFATFNPLPSGDYAFELKDPNSNYFFDTMKITIDSSDKKPIEILSKESL